MDSILAYQCGALTDEGTLVHAVTDTAYTFSLSAGRTYRICCDVDMAVRASALASGAAATVAASAYIPAKTTFFMRATTGKTYLSCIRVGATSGTATVTAVVV